MSSTNVIETVDNRGYSLGPMADLEPGEKIRLARETRGWSQADLAKKIGISQPAIKKIEGGETRTSKFLPRIGVVLDIPLNELDPTLDRPIDAVIPKEHLQESGRDFPIHAVAEGGAGTIIVDSAPVDWAPRPSPLARVPRAYGLLIVGESMLPEYRPGETALVNPNLPVIAGEVYIFYAEREGEAKASIKQLRRATATEWQVSQHNPKKEFVLPKRDWQWAHRVIGKYSRQ
jgi:phage repressor protein C with HTH and peptisase S24 domain